MIAAHQRRPSSAPNHRQKSLQLNVGIGGSASSSRASWYWIFWSAYRGWSEGAVAERPFLQDGKEHWQQDQNGNRRGNHSAHDRHRDWLHHIVANSAFEKNRCQA